MIKLKEKATILSARSDAYDFNGRQGVSHKVRVNIGGEIFVLNANADQVKEMKEYIGDEMDINLELSSPKERIKLELSSSED